MLTFLEYTCLICIPLSIVTFKMTLFFRVTVSLRNVFLTVILHSEQIHSFGGKDAKIITSSEMCQSEFGWQAQRKWKI